MFCRSHKKNVFWLSLIVIEIIGIATLFEHQQYGCEEFKQECIAEWPKNPDGKDNHFSCYIQITNTTIGCASLDENYMIYCLSGHPNKTFTCYTRLWTSRNNVYCGVHPMCFNTKTYVVMIVVMAICHITISFVIADILWDIRMSEMTRKRQ